MQAKRELAGAKAHIAKLTDEMHRVLAQERKQHAAAAKPKTNRPPLPPDEARERTIKGLRTRVHNLEAALNAFHLMAHMPSETPTAVDWVMQPDQRSNATKERWDNAAKAWNVWKNDYDRARRPVR